VTRDVPTHSSGASSAVCEWRSRLAKLTGGRGVIEGHVYDPAPSAKALSATRRPCRTLRQNVVMISDRQEQPLWN